MIVCLLQSIAAGAAQDRNDQISSEASESLSRNAVSVVLKDPYQDRPKDPVQPYVFLPKLPGRRILGILVEDLGQSSPPDPFRSVDQKPPCPADCHHLPESIVVLYGPVNRCLGHIQGIGHCFHGYVVSGKQKDRIDIIDPFFRHVDTMPVQCLIQQHLSDLRRDL